MTATATATAEPLQLVATAPAPAALPAVAHGSAVAHPASGTDALMRIIDRAASDPNFDIAKLERLLEVKREWAAEEARVAMSGALVALSSEPIEIFKKKHVHFPVRNKADGSGGGEVDYWHAELSDVTDAVKPVMGRLGLGFRWDEVVEGKTVRCRCVIRHALGHEVEGNWLPGPYDDSGKKNQIQQMASTISYLRRYTLLGALGMATKGMDDDGRGGADPAEPPGDAGQGDPPPDPPADFYPADRFAANLPAWHDVIRDGRKTADELIGWIETRHPLSEQQQAQLRAVKKA